MFALPTLRTTALKLSRASLRSSLAYSKTMKTLAEAIKDDHDEMYEYHDQYERARHRGDVDAQARWVRQLTWEVARHAIGEEIVVYPLMEQHLGNKGKQLADHDREDHLQVKQYLYSLESIPPGSDQHHSLVTIMMSELKRHNDSEEINDLPPLEQTIGKLASEEAAGHPSIPNKPPAETVIGLLEAPIDKIKDWFSSFPTESEMAEAKEELKEHVHEADPGKTASAH
uniref:Mitochondrial division protein 1 n=1 Tax=Ganoderma boninense TaxID=34458 RepID=A0A5K1JYD3_9APHY|nr:Mitochondrial division protein 1 [Ganoderma boninense]